MLINKDELLAALQIIDLVPIRVGIPSSEFIKMYREKKSIACELTAEVLGKASFKSNDSEESSAYLKTPFYVDRRVLLPFISHESKVKDVKLELVGKSLVFKHGRRKLSLTPVAAISGYSGDQKAATDIKLKLTDEQKEIAQCAAKYAPQDNSLPQLQCVFFDKSGVVLSSNSTNVFYSKTKKIPQSIMFPVYLMTTLTSQQVEEVSIGKKTAKLVFPTGTLMQTLPSQTVKGFPIKNLTSLAAYKNPLVFEVKAKRFIQVLSQFSTVVAANKDKVIKIEGVASTGKVKVTGSVSHAKFNDTFTCEVKKDFECEWLADGVLPFVEFAAKKDAVLSVSFTDKSPYYIAADASLLIVSRKAN